MTLYSSISVKTGSVFYGWIVVVIGAILTFLGTGFYSYSRGVFLPSLAEELADGSRFEIAMGFSIAAVTSAVIAPFLGRFLDTHSPRRVILIGIGIVTFSYLLLSVCQTLWQFYLIIGLGMGLGMSCMGNLAWHRTVISWFDHWRGRAIALGVLGASLAGVVMPPLVTALVAAVGWRSSFVIFAVIVISILTPLVYFYLKDRPEDVGEVRDGLKYVESNKEQIVEMATETRLWRWQEMLRFPAFWSIGLMFGAMGCVYSAVMLHLFGHLKDIGLSPANAAWILSATALFAALGKPVVGWMSDVFGARVTIWMALIMQCIALLMFANADDFYLSLLAGCTYGFGYAGMSPLRTFAISVAMGNSSFGTANGVLRLVELPLVISASPLAGYIYDSTGSYKIAFVILAGLMAFACVGPFFIQAGGARERQRVISRKAA
ncbi:MAG: MFS transporter [bacterium]|nr:MFS transporter [Gammaproteobacteria bacterium]